MENFCTDLLKSWVDRVLAPACRLNPLIYILGWGLFVHTCPRSTEKCSKFWANEHRYKAVEFMQVVDCWSWFWRDGQFLQRPLKTVIQAAYCYTGMYILYVGVFVHTYTRLTELGKINVTAECRRRLQRVDRWGWFWKKWRISAESFQHWSFALDRRKNVANLGQIDDGKRRR